MPNEAAFFIGALAGMLALWILQRWSRIREQKRVAGVDAAELTAVNRPWFIYCESYNKSLRIHHILSL